MFQLSRHQTTVKREVLAGLTTFITIAYAIVIVPSILKDAGMPFGSTMAATVLSAGIASILMGLIANYPFVLCSGFGMAAYFTYSLVIQNKLPWQEALGVIFIAAILMLLLWAMNWRQKLIEAIPQGLKLAATGGIGLFLVLIAFKNMHLVVPYAQTLMGLGNFQRPEVLLFGIGLILTTSLKFWKVPGAFMISIVLLWIAGVMMGLVPWKGIIGWPSVGWETFFAFRLETTLSLKLAPAILTFLIVYLFDASGTLISLAHQGHFLNEKGTLTRMKKALFADGFGSLLAALFGSSATVNYIESGAGIAAGGRTGLTAVVAGICLIIAFFFEPLASSIPFFAVAPALVIVGALMLRPVSQLPWNDLSELIPSYVTLVAIPYTFSIGTGIGVGVMFYPLCKLFMGKISEVRPLMWVLVGLFILKFFLSY